MSEKIIFNETPLERKWREEKEKQEKENVSEANVIEEANIREGDLRSYNFNTKVIMQLPEGRHDYVLSMMKKIQEVLNEQQVIQIKDEEDKIQRFTINFSNEKIKDFQLMKNSEIRNFIVDLILQNNIQKILGKEVNDVSFTEDDLRRMEKHFNGEFIFIEEVGLIKKSAIKNYKEKV